MATFTGTAGADTITPATRSAGVTVTGTPTNLSGNDTLNGLAGDDLLDGGIGNDRIDGGTGGPSGDRLFGNVGDDVLSVIPSGLGTRIDGGVGTDMLSADLGPSPINPLGLIDYSRATIVSVEQLTTFGVAKLTTAQLNAFTTLVPSIGFSARVALADSAQAIDLTGNLSSDLRTLTIYGSASGGNANIRVDPLFLGRFDYLGDTNIATRDTVIGGNGSNFLNGGAGDDLLIGGRGNDTFNGGAGNDTVSYASSTSGVTVLMAFTTPQNTGAGTDTLVSVENLIGSAFGDDLNGDEGVNRLTGGDGGDILDGRGGRDVLDGGIGIDIFNVDGVQGPSPASIVGGAGTDALNAFGADLRSTAISGVEALFADSVVLTSAQVMGFSQIAGIEGLSLRIGDATRAVDLTGKLSASPLIWGVEIIGSAGNDQISVGATYAQPVVLRGAPPAMFGSTVGTGNDVLRGGAGGDLLSGYDGNDQLFGNGGGDFLIGGTGFDLLVGGAGDDRLSGGADTDTASYAGSAAGVTVSTAITVAQNTIGAGVDTLESIENLVGSSFADILRGDAGANFLSGAGGADVLDSLAGGRDILDGGDGDDNLYLGAGGQAIVAGGAGASDMILFEGTDLRGTAISGVEVLSLRGAAPVSLTSAQAMGFVQIASIGKLALQLGDALRAVDLTGKIFPTLAPGGVEIAGSTGNDQIAVGATYAQAVTLRGFVAGAAGDPVGTGNDLLRGGAVNDSLYGYDGNDQLFGNAGNDFLAGGVGDDVLTGGAGGDYLAGGLGTDTASYAGSTAGVTVTLGMFVQDTVGAGFETMDSMENLLGSAFADTLRGDTGANRLTGGAGGDRLYGDAGADLLSGEAGVDFLDGGAAADLLYGGLDADRFWFAGPVAAGTPADRIFDFSVAQGDQVQIGNGVTGVDDAAWRVVSSGTFGTLQSLSGGVWSSVVTIDNAAGLTLAQVVLNPVV